MDILSGIEIGSELKTIIIATISMGAMALFSLYRKVFASLWFIIWKHITTSVTITSSSWVFYTLIKILERDNLIKQLRTVKFTAGRYGDDNSIGKCIGNGTHLVKLYGHYCFVTMKVPENQPIYGEQERMICVIQWFGRCNKRIDEFAKFIENERTCNDVGKISMFAYPKDMWREIGTIMERNFDTIFLEKSKKDILISSIKFFLENKEWYANKGIPWRIGILLHGVPGSGKTSIIKAIASYFNRSILILPADNLEHIGDAFISATNNSIIVIEDIDTINVVKKRKINSNDESAKLDENNRNQLEIKRISLSGILNAIDGVFSKEGRILVITTNHKDALDPALLRPGRIDVDVNVGYANSEILSQFVKAYYGKEVVCTINDEYAEKITCADIQNYYMQHNPSLEEFMKKYCKE